ncbi:hypothetical protein [Mycolicibacterium phlei]|jgi:hypothetical protein
MTSAVIQAAVLRKCLSHSAVDDFFAACARTLSPLWWANRAADYAVLPPRARTQELLKRRVNR